MRPFLLTITLLSAGASFAQNSLPVTSATATKTATDLRSGTPAIKVSSQATTTTHVESALDTMLSEDLIISLRDPFQLPAVLLTKKDAPKTELETYPLKDFKLNGVVTGPKKTRAMVTSPANKVYFLRIGDHIGVRDGKVTQIASDSIKVLEYYTDEHGKRIPDVYLLNISGEMVSLSKKEEE